MSSPDGLWLRASRKSCQFSVFRTGSFSWLSCSSSLGLPVALGLAWAFELTPEGIKRTETADAMPDATRRKKYVWIYVVVIGGLLSIGLFFLGRYSAAPTQNAAVETSVKSIAVLPFENLSDDKQNTYFADGVQDQILTNLARVSDLRVISHTTVRQYKSGEPRNLREIGKQLGVTHILEGSVQRAGDRLRIAAQLIDARTDSQIWAETYDRTAADLFAIQSELAESIVAQLQAKLSPEQKAEIEERPTQDLVAFELYLRAKQIVDSYLIAEDVRAALLSALQSLDQAIKRDPDFVSAYCYIARANDLLYFFDLDPTPDRILLAEAAVKAALRLRPDSAEAHFAMADFLFRCHRDYDGALKELAIARPGLPNDTAFFILSGYINRRRNNWAQAERDFSTAVALDPETRMLTICSLIPTTCNESISWRRRFTTACWLRASARQLFSSGGTQPFSMEPAIQQSCASAVGKPRHGHRRWTNSLPSIVRIDRR